MSNNTSAWAQQCPLCGQPNQCAVAQGLPAEQCWCMTTQLSPAALARIPEEERRQRCICPACGQVNSGALPDGADATAATALRPELR